MGHKRENPILENFLISPEVVAAVKRTHARVKAAIEREIALQGGTWDQVMEIRHREALDHVLDAESLDEAEELGEKAYRKVYLSCLFLRSKNKICPRTPYEYEKKAAKARSNAKSTLKKHEGIKVLDEDDVLKRSRLMAQYERGIARADKLDTYAKMLREDPNVAPFEVLFPKEVAEEPEEVEEVEEQKPKEKKPRKPKATKGAKPARRRRTA